MPSLVMLSIGIAYIAAHIAIDNVPDMLPVPFCGLKISPHTRSLLISLIVLLVIITVGVLFDMFQLGLTFSDAVYDAVQTAATGVLFFHFLLWLGRGRVCK